MSENKTSIQKNMLFNTVGSMVYYFCQWLLSIVIVRISGYEAAGVFGIATTLTASPAILALFNVRNYQVSDLRGQYTTKTYIQSRHYTNLLAYVVCMGMVLVGDYSWEKAAVVLVFMLYKLAEGTADVYYGVEQRWGRLDYAGISLSLRGLLTIVPFVILQKLFNNLLLSLGVVAICSYAVVLIYDRIQVKHLLACVAAGREEVQFKAGQEEAQVAAGREEAQIKQGQKEIFGLLVTCIPLAFVAFLNNLAFNYPKIVLESHHGSEIMGYFTSITSPALVVQLAANTIFAPLVTPLTDAFLRRDKKAFDKIIRNFILFMAVLSAVVLAGSALLGRWAIILLFGEGIEPYTYLFVPSIGVTLCLATTSVLISICTLLREIKLQYFVGAAGIVASFAFAQLLVPSLGMEGVLWAQTGTVLAQVAIQLMIIGRRLHLTWKKDRTSLTD
ncbi:MAG: hypothetical protein PUF45_09580 [Lachnospiraceae bacterium]|nr:hypothetical protein [Lachnospiraceae bacterium]